MAPGNFQNWGAFILALALVTQFPVTVNGSPRRFMGMENMNSIFDISSEETGGSSPSVLVAPFGLVAPVLNASRLVCRTSRMIDQYSLMHAQLCMERLMKNQELSLFAATSPVLAGDLKDIIKGQCDIFRQMQSCASRVFTFLSECVGNGDEFMKMLNAQIKFVCEANYNETEETQLTEGLKQGFACVLNQRESLKTCITSKSNGEAKLSDNMQAELMQLSMRGIYQLQLVPGGRTKNKKICSSLGVIDQCFSEKLLGACRTPAPEHVLTSMYLKVGQALQCDVSRFSRNRPHLAEMLASKSTVRMMKLLANNLSD